MKRLICLLFLAITLLSFTTIHKTIVEKIEQNLFEGWVIQEIDSDKTQFSDEMKDLQVEYGLTLINQDLPIELETYYGTMTKFPEIKVLVSDVASMDKMVDLVYRRSKKSNFKHCFITTRHYLLTFIWTECRIEYLNPQGEKTYAEFGGSSVYQRHRTKLLKNLAWYFEQYG